MARTAPVVAKPTAKQASFMNDDNLEPKITKAATKTPAKGSTKATGRPVKRAGEKVGHAPSGDKRLTVNLREDLHQRLRVQAAVMGVTIGKLIEQLTEEHVPKVKL